MLIISYCSLKKNFLADCRSRVVAAGIVCPGFVDIHTHCIGGHEDVIQEIMSSFRSILTNTFTSYFSSKVLVLD